MEDLLLLKGYLNGKRAYLPPDIVEIDITNECDNSCIGCWIHSPYTRIERRLTRLSGERVASLANELAAMGVREIQISGSGEPLLHPAILEIIEAVKNTDIRCHLITSATLLDEKKIMALVRSRLDMITVSLWAGTAPTYSRIHPDKEEGTFNRIKDMLQYLYAVKREIALPIPQVRIYNVICSYNFKEIEPMLDLALNVKADFLEFQPVDIIRGKTDFLSLDAAAVSYIEKQMGGLRQRVDYMDELIGDNISDPPGSPRIKELREFGRFVSLSSGFTLEDSIRRLRCPAGRMSDSMKMHSGISDFNYIEYGFDGSKCSTCSQEDVCYKSDSKTGVIRAGLLTLLGIEGFLRRIKSAGGYEKDMVDKVPCYAPWIYSKVLSNGDIIPCCKADGFHLGSIYKDSFMKIWNGRRYRDFRKRIKAQGPGERSSKGAYIASLDCSRFCDNLGMNIKTARIVSGTGIRDGKELKERLRAVRKEDALVIRAKDFSRGDFITHKNPFGKDLIVDSGTGRGFAEYDIYFKKRGEYELWSYYASGEPRPVRMYLDDFMIRENGLSRNTGGVTEKELKWYKEMYIHIEPGYHTLKLESDGLIPHIKTLKFIRAASRKDSILSKYIFLAGPRSSESCFIGPSVAELEITDHCNSSCIGCWCHSPLLKKKKVSSGHLGLQHIKGLVDHLYALGTKEIRISGSGEPFMHPDIKDIISHIKSKGLICNIVTNFTLVDRDMALFLLDQEVDMITISLWAGSGGSYVATHPGSSGDIFLRIGDMIRFIRQERKCSRKKYPKIKIYNVISNINYKEIMEMLDFALESGADFIEYSPVDIIKGTTDGLALGKEETEYILHKMDALLTRSDHLEIEKHGSSDMSSIEKEKKEYARFLRKESLAPGFRYQLESVDSFQAYCPKGYKHSRVEEEHGEENRLKFFFSGSRCLLCDNLPGCSIEKDRFMVSAEYLSFFGYGSFYRRINSLGTASGSYDSGVIEDNPCFVGWTYTRVLSNGDVVPCCKGTGKGMGNIKDPGGFMGVWSSEKYAEFRKKAKYLTKSDPYFSSMECNRICDNLGANLDISRSLSALNLVERKILDIVKFLMVKKHG